MTQFCIRKPAMIQRAVNKKWARVLEQTQGEEDENVLLKPVAYYYILHNWRRRGPSDVSASFCKRAIRLNVRFLELCFPDSCWSLLANSTILTAQHNQHQNQKSIRFWSLATSPNLQCVDEWMKILYWSWSPFPFLVFYSWQSWPYGRLVDLKRFY